MVEKDIILKYALQNAIFYSGKANPRAVLGKILAQEPELRKNVKVLEDKIQGVVEEINKLPIEEQRQQLEELARLRAARKEEVTLQEQANPGAKKWWKAADFLMGNMYEKKY